MKLNLFCNIRFLFLALVLLGSEQLMAQNLDAPVPAPNQNPPVGSSPWTAACASASFNNYWVNFTWAPPLVNGDNEFILELSNASGSFANPTELARAGDKNTNFDFFFEFNLPTDTRGEGYLMRVRSTSPAVTGPSSAAFSMYYIDFDSPLLISQNGSGTIPPGGTIEVCNGNSITLSPHNIPNPNTYQYNWFRSGTPLSEKSASLTVNQAGMYLVEVDYGSCSGSANTLSNTIEITAGTSLGVAINPPAKTALCSGETQNLEANINNGSLTYTWYKDGVSIPSSNNYIYTVDASVAGFEGDYQVEIDGPGTCLERSTAVAITNAGSFTVTRNNAANVVVLPGQTQNLSVTTDASSPTYQWYRDGNPIGGATSNSITVAETETGSYFARVSLSGSGPCSSTSIDSEATTVVTPASFELIVDYNTTYSACQNTDVVLAISTINAVAADNSRTDVTTDLLSTFTYQWKKDGINIGGATSSNISLTGPSENGSYEVDGTLSAYNATSNSLPVQLRVNIDISISSTSLTYCPGGDPVTLSSVLDLSGESYEWQRDGATISTTDATFTVDATGTYRLVVSRGGCDINSNELVIAPFDASQITLDSPDNVVFPEGSSRTVTASGGTAYSWFDENNSLLSSTESVTFTEEGNYLLVANIDACEVTRPLTVVYLDTFRVPNVITVNGDGINDLWIIPNSYSNNPDVNVIIYNDQGEEVLNQFDYQNNWPQSSVAFQKQNMVFFYKIRNATEVLKQGTITIIR
ncbi:gliding motility-associated C-terminal domain-containing protein [Spongiimicrobium sp. 3-5]|uniref:T9SS type B sorting domain-containing protein n=1 Tax=Spongiimicrobium sp. 3-5 TaxID=3332596 RepID=UPI00397F975D